MRRVYYSFHEIPFGQYEYRRGISFSREEINHLLISIAVLTLAFSIAFSYPININYPLFIFFLPISFLAIVTAFACHEIAHKYAGMKLGYWSEYRMFPQGLIFALLFSFAGVVFAAPGAVQIFGMPTREESGKISMAGPATNIALAFIFFVLSSVALKGIFLSVASINAFLALFNLIPFGPLDGRKIFAWNIAIWIVMLAMSIVLLVFSYLLASPYF